MKYLFKVIVFRIMSWIVSHSPMVRIFVNDVKSVKFTKPIVIFLFGEFGYGGAENYIQSIINHLKQNYDCILVTESYLHSSTECDTTLFDLKKYSSNKLTQLCLITKLIQVLKPHILGNATSASFYRAYIADHRTISCNVNKLYFFFFSYELIKGLDLSVIKNIYKDSKYIITDNKRCLDDINFNYGSIIKCEKSVCLYNKVKFEYNDHAFNKNIFHAVRNIRLQKRKFLWASRLDKDKNLRLLIEVLQMNTMINIDIYGKSLFNNAKNEVQELFSLANVNYLGEFSDINQSINHSIDYCGFIFTSFWEGLPNILLEVGLLGLPIIAPKVGGVGELISEDTGFLVKNNCNSYSTAIQYMFDYPDEVSRRAFNLRTLILNRHNDVNYQEMIIRLFVT